jgi:cbb3-type cytochrome oxidase cytochrome c subunit
VSRNSWYTSGWQGVSLVAITYVYFLIFAQFAFLKRLASLGIAGSHLAAVMIAMAIGGVILSLLTPRMNFLVSAYLRLRFGFCVSAAAAFLSLLPLTLAASVALSMLIGAGLGLLTVTLVTHLRQWTGDSNQLVIVGFGTGVGYLICNIPFFFTIAAEVQTAIAGLLCLIGIGVTLRPARITLESAITQPQPTVSFLAVLVCFTALVWLDSAAFFIIQQTPQLKAGTWEGTAHLWTNGVLHLLAALASAWLLIRRRLPVVLLCAFFALGVACLLLIDPHRVALASVFYPIGVSLYSVALVAYPALLSPASSVAERGCQAGWLYAIAGWSGSALGIGMGQNLGHIPPQFVIAAGTVVLWASSPGIVQQRKRELSLILTALLATLVLNDISKAGDTPIQISRIERGRQVYISEGCINCHSQYVRPNSTDVLMWGPVESLAQLRLKRPPLIGNRRQGPDLSEVGGRRSALWLKLHFLNPLEVSGASIMPSYALLFQDQRGDDLVSYLASLHGSGLAQHRAAEQDWHLSSSAVATANVSDGNRLFHRYCATCHDAGGQTRWEAGFKRLPPDLSVGPYLHLSPSEDLGQRRDRLARIVKFGVYGTDMPGHEYLSDNNIASISLWLSQQILHSNHNP